MRKNSWLLITAALVSLLPALHVPPVRAQEMASEGELARVRKKVEALRAWRLTEELDLDEETSARLFPAIREADQERRRIEARNRELVREMARELNGQAAQTGRIDEILDELTSNRQEMARVEERHLNRVRQILDSEGSARYLLFQLKFQREMKRKAAEAFREGRKAGEDSKGPRGEGDGGSGGGAGSGTGDGPGGSQGGGSGGPGGGRR